MQLILAILVSIQAHTQPIGFLVVESTHNQIKVIKTQDMGVVNSISNCYHVDARELLKENNYFEVRTDWNKLYVERKRVVKKKGKLKYKRIK